MSNVNSDLLDEGLQSVMGKDRCQDVWTIMPEGAEKLLKEHPINPRKPTHSFKDGKWEPVKEITWLDKLKDCAKWTSGFGALSMLLFYWNLEGLMASSVAVPSMCVCTLMAGFGIGKTVGGK